MFPSNLPNASWFCDMMAFISSLSSVPNIFLNSVSDSSSDSSPSLVSTLPFSISIMVLFIDCILVCIFVVALLKALVPSYNFFAPSSIVSIELFNKSMLLYKESNLLNTSKSILSITFGVITE